jgi:hypothetical protein
VLHQIVTSSTGPKGLAPSASHPPTAAHPPRTQRLGLPPLCQVSPPNRSHTETTEIAQETGPSTRCCFSRASDPPAVSQNTRLDRDQAPSPLCHWYGRRHGPSFPKLDLRRRRRRDPRSSATVPWVRTMIATPLISGVVVVVVEDPFSTFLDFRDSQSGGGPCVLDLLDFCWCWGSGLFWVTPRGDDHAAELGKHVGERRDDGVVLVRYRGARLRCSVTTSRWSPGVGVTR